MRPRLNVAREDRANRIDELVENRLSRMGIEPEPLVDDSTWMRRSSLVSIGRLPTANEVREWMADEEPQRREKWVDRLLADPGYDWMWALHWSDVLRNEPKVMSLKGPSSGMIGCDVNMQKIDRSMPSFARWSRLLEALLIIHQPAFIARIAIP